jgi:hypothetical protein
MSPLLQRSPRKSRQHKARSMNIRIVISAQLLFFLSGEATNRLLHITVGILAADHEADLAGGVRGDGCVGVFDGWEDFFAVSL